MCQSWGKWYGVGYETAEKWCIHNYCIKQERTGKLLDQLEGFVNSDNKDNIIATVKKDTEEIIKTIEQSDSVEAKDKLEKCLQRLQALGNKYNAAEGIVVMWKDRRMKFTGSFAALNQALGTRFMMEK